MASWDGGSGGGSGSGDFEEKDDFLKPSPSQLVLTPQPPEEIQPDSEENVQEQTEDLFRNFVYQTYRNETSHQPYNSTPVSPELVNLPRIPDRSEHSYLFRLLDINNKFCGLRVKRN
jgi:hypothetical protein